MMRYCHRISCLSPYVSADVDRVVPLIEKNGWVGVLRRNQAQGENGIDTISSNGTTRCLICEASDKD